MEQREPGVTEEDLWNNVCRIIFRKLERFKDVISGSSKKNKGNTQTPNVQEELQRKNETEKEEEELYLKVMIMIKVTVMIIRYNHKDGFVCNRIGAVSECGK